MAAWRGYARGRSAFDATAASACSVLSSRAASIAWGVWVVSARQRSHLRRTLPVASARILAMRTALGLLAWVAAAAGLRHALARLANTVRDRRRRRRGGARAPRAARFGSACEAFAARAAPVISPAACSRMFLVDGCFAAGGGGGAVAAGDAGGRAEPAPLRARVVPARERGSRRGDARAGARPRGGQAGLPTKGVVQGVRRRAGSKTGSTRGEWRAARCARTVCGFARRRAFEIDRELRSSQPVHSKLLQRIGPREIVAHHAGAELEPAKGCSVAVCRVCAS